MWVNYSFNVCLSKIIIVFWCVIVSFECVSDCVLCWSLRRRGKVLCASVWRRGVRTCWFSSESRQILHLRKRPESKTMMVIRGEATPLYHPLPFCLHIFKHFSSSNQCLSLSSYYIHDVCFLITLSAGLEEGPQPFDSLKLASACKHTCLL